MQDESTYPVTERARRFKLGSGPSVLSGAGHWACLGAPQSRPDPAPWSVALVEPLLEVLGESTSEAKSTTTSSGRGEPGQIMLSKLWKSAKAKLGSRNGASTWVVLTRDGFGLNQGDSRLGSVRWEEVDKVLAFKRDLLTSDEVCLAFEIGDSDTVFELNEGVGSFWDLVARVKEVFPDSEQDWEETVVNPAFAENSTVLYERPGPAK